MEIRIISKMNDTENTFLYKKTDKTFEEIQNFLENLFEYDNARSIINLLITDGITNYWLDNNIKNSDWKKKLVKLSNKYLFQYLPKVFQQTESFNNYITPDDELTSFSTKKDRYGIISYFPCIDKKSINSFFISFFREFEIDDKKFELYARYDDEFFDFDELLFDNREISNIKTEQFGFIDSQMEFMFLQLQREGIKNELEYLKPFTKQVEIKVKDVENHNGSGTDMFDFGPWNK